MMKKDRRKQVKIKDGRLVLSRAVTNGLNKPVKSLTFINKYSADGKTGPDGQRPGDSKTGGLKEGPRTGDDFNPGLYIALLALGGALAAGGTVYLTASGRRKGGYKRTR